VLYLFGWGGRSKGSWVRSGRERGLSEDSGIKFYNSEIKYINNWLLLSLSLVLL
jgi:hypothetical protein